LFNSTGTARAISRAIPLPFNGGCRLRIIAAQTALTSGHYAGFVFRQSEAIPQKMSYCLAPDGNSLKKHLTRTYLACFENIQLRGL